jgi:hypothetical protein
MIGRAIEILDERTNDPCVCVRVGVSERVAMEWLGVAPCPSIYRQDGGLVENKHAIS